MADLTDFSYGKTTCQKRPELCEPRKIKHVAWDADETMWDIIPHRIASSVSGPFKLIDPDTLEAGAVEPTPAKKVEKKPITPIAGAFEDWWTTRMSETSPSLIPITPEDELAAIEKELAASLPKPKAEEEKPLGEAPIYIEDLKMVDKNSMNEQAKQKEIKALLRNYGNKTCRVVDVSDSGDITIQCREDQWIMSKYGWLRRALLLGAAGKKKLKGGLVREHVKVSKEPYYSLGGKVTVKLLPTMRDTLAELEKRGITSSVISMNSPNSVRRILEAFGLDKKFIEIKDTWDAKSKVFEQITEKHHVCPCNAMFVDNMTTNVSAVADKCALGLVIGPHGDIQKPIEVMNYIEAAK